MACSNKRSVDLAPNKSRDLRDSALGLRDLSDLVGEHEMEGVCTTDHSIGLRRFLVGCAPINGDAGCWSGVGLLSDRAWFCTFPL